MTRAPVLLLALACLFPATDLLPAANVPSRTANLTPRRPALPPLRPGDSKHPVDRLISAHARTAGPTSLRPLTDLAFARRVHLDLVGLLPTASQTARFLADPSTTRRDLLIKRLLADRQGYAAHWMVFWNDCLRNAYRGTGFIDDGRRQISGWLYRSLYANKPYDKFAHQLTSPVKGSGGFIRGIKWRGVVNASQQREVQAAQSLAQVFLVFLAKKAISARAEQRNQHRRTAAQSFHIFTDALNNPSRFMTIDSRKFAAPIAIHISDITVTDCACIQPYVDLTRSWHPKIYILNRKGCAKCSTNRSFHFDDFQLCEINVGAFAAGSAFIPS